MSTFIIFGNLERPFERMAISINKIVKKLPKPIIIQAGSNVGFFDPGLDSLIVFPSCDYYEFYQYIKNAEIVITHAGVGATKGAIIAGFKPAVFVREYEKREHIDNHQQDWATYLESKHLICVCNDSFDLDSYLSNGTTRLDDTVLPKQFFSCENLKKDLRLSIESILGGSF